MEEQLHRHPLLIGAERGVDRFGTARQHAADAAEGAVSVQGQRRARTLVEELGEGELQERERAGPVGGIGDKLHQERLLDVDTSALGRADDDRLELARPSSATRSRRRG